MPVPRAVLTGLMSQNGPTAFMPLRAMTPSTMDIGRSQGTPEDVTGQPGTQGIPAPYPNPGQVGVQQGGVVALDYLPSGLSASQYMPPRWYPTLYYRGQHLSGGIGGVRVYSDNLMPMPAVDPRGLPVGGIGPAAFAAYSGLTPTSPARPNRWVKGLGQRQVLWPKRTPEWPPTWPQQAGAGG
jgi:hypothetical protein